MGFISGVVVRLRAVTSSDWAGAAGDRFRRTTQIVSDFSKEHIRPEDIPKETARGLRRLLIGRSSRDHAEAARGYAETEESRLRVMRELATFDDHVAQERSRTEQETIKTRMLKMDEMLKRVELVEKFQKLDVLPVWSGEGVMTFVKAPPDVDWTTLSERLSEGEFAALRTGTKARAKTE